MNERWSSSSSIGSWFCSSDCRLVADLSVVMLLLLACLLLLVSVDLIIFSSLCTVLVNVVIVVVVVHNYFASAISRSRLKYKIRH